MDSATITSKSQITLPKSVREALGADVGDKIMFYYNDSLPESTYMKEVTL